MVDRFDVRAHLDHLPEYNHKTDKEELSDKETKELRQQNYERYKILIQNQFLSVSEDKFLQTIDLEEKYGGKSYQGKKAKEDKQKSGAKAAIGFKYEDSTEVDYTGGDNDSDVDSDEEDFDLNFDVTSLDSAQVHEINKIGHHYGLERKDVFKFFTKDYEEQEEIKANKAKSEAKSEGKKKRRRNRENREYEGQHVSPSYALKEEQSKSRSRSRTDSSESESDDAPLGEEKIEFITSFGGESDQEKNKLDSSTDKRRRKSSKSKKRSKDKRTSRSRDRSRHRGRRSRSRSRSNDDWVRRRHKKRSRSRSRSVPVRRSSRSVSRERSRIEKRLSRALTPPDTCVRSAASTIRSGRAFTPPPAPTMKHRLTQSDDHDSDTDSSDDGQENNGATRYDISTVDKITDVFHDH